MKEPIFKEFEKAMSSKNDFEEHMANLWKTRQGLCTIMERRPELKEVIMPQFTTLNELIGSLINDRPYHPYSGCINYKGERPKQSQKRSRN